MTSTGLGEETGKEAVGTRAAEAVSSGMVLGLGTGSTVFFFLQALGKRLQQGDLNDIVGVPTSLQTEEEARRQGIPLTTLEAAGTLDLTVDGADEVDPALDLIKGMGGALLREKMVAQASRRFLVIVDDRKLVSCLGTRSPLPVEVVPFGWGSHLRFLEEQGARAVLRTRPDGFPFVTDNGNHLLECHFEGGIPDTGGLAQALAHRAGVVGDGLFLGLAHEVLVSSDGGVRALTRGEERTL
ncbi:ribose 5-phosphate isomerase A [Gemmatimonadota bacterium]